MNSTTLCDHEQTERTVNIFPAAPTTGPQLADMLGGPHAHVIRPADDQPGTLAQQLRYAAGDAESPTWSSPEPLPVGFRERLVATLVDDPDLCAAIRRAVA